MAQINVSKLTFAYEGSAENVFEQVSFSIDTNWKLGFIGRNGKGKTTFLNLLLGKYAYQGSITKGIAYDYFPYRVSVEEGELTADELMERFGIATRSGAHCAPLAHKALGTVDTGAVRFSFSYFNTMEDAKEAAEAVRTLATE